MSFVSAYAPGHVELLGNHIDHDEGYVLSAAIDRGIHIEATLRNDDKIVFESATMDGKIALDQRYFRPLKKETWASYPAGIVKCFLDEGLKLPGFEALISSNLPVGAGLSSSATLEVATATLLNKLSGSSMDTLRLARLCRKAESDFADFNCGLLDQISSAFGTADHAIFLDCRKESVETIAFPQNVALLITDSGVKNPLPGGNYSGRRKECFDAAEKLGAKALRDLSLEQLRDGSDLLGNVLFRRALHIVEENARVLKAIGLLCELDIRGFGELMFESHESLQINFENSAAELDTLVDIARKVEGVFGSRLIGDGFGGATASLVSRKAANSAAIEFAARYKERTGLVCETYVCEIAEGAH